MNQLFLSRQCLPVVPKANRGGITATCINRSDLWSHFTIMELSENKRVTARRGGGTVDRTLQEFDAWTLSIGDGTAPVVEGENQIQLPPNLCVEIDPTATEDSMSKFCEEIWPHLELNYMEENYLGGRAILAPTNKKVDRVNDLLTKKLPGQEVVLVSADMLTDQEDPFRFSVEYLNTLEPSGLPSHQLRLKHGMPLMLLRNLNSRKGLCNGTKLIFNRVLGNSVLECKIPGDPQQRPIFIPRVTLRPKDGQYGFDWARRQFPGNF